MNFILNYILNIIKFHLLYQQKNIIIIGAGVCGLYTAVNLKKHYKDKYNILVIENRVIKDGYKKKNPGLKLMGDKFLTLPVPKE